MNVSNIRKVTHKAAAHIIKKNCEQIKQQTAPRIVAMFAATIMNNHGGGIYAAQCSKQNIKHLKNAGMKKPIARPPMQVRITILHGNLSEIKYTN
jgi:hypothetical protein